jgi:Ca2+ transporting ATPase
MITGDNIVTAQAIAEKCGIIAKDEMGDPEVCMGGPEFYEMMGGLIEKDGKERVKNMGAFKKIAPKLKVMARSRPEDKYLLVTGLMNMNQVVAVTGDGTNDAMALSKADVGFGMGKTGTAVCKKAADIIIVDDSFTSVVKACSWGRNIYDNIKAFLQFQLTVNVNALIFTVIGAVLLKESPLQAIQLLWVNMIMDSLASLALATELPKPELLLRPPQVKDDFVVSRKMTKHILYMSLFQMVILFIFLFGGEYMIPEPDVELRFNQFYPIVDMDIKDSEMVFPGRLYKVNGDPLYKIVQEANNDDSSRHMTFIFNLFIWLQIINMIAARKIHDEKNLCKGFFDNPMFLIIWVLIVAVNFLIIQYTGPFFSLHPKGLSWEQHVLCIGVSFSVLFCNLLLKCLPDDVAPLLGKDSVDAVRVAMREDARRNGGQA